MNQNFIANLVAQMQQVSPQLFEGKFIEREIPLSDWEQIRLGRFTASKIADLCTKARNGGFGATAMNYIFSVVAQRCGEFEDSVQTKEMLFGIEKESEAADYLESQNIIPPFRYDSRKFYEHPLFPDYAGASPDFVGHDFVGDFKIPYTLRNYLKQCNSAFDIKTLKTELKDYYYQLQMQMLCAQKEKAYLVFYRPKTDKNPEMCRVFTVPKCEATCNEINEAIASAALMVDCIARQNGLMFQ